MIALDTIKDSLAGSGDRYSAYALALEWTVDRLRDIPRYLLPPVEGEAGEAALQRLGRRATSAGPRAFKHIRDGSIGEVNWGGNDDELDEALTKLHLNALARRLFERAAIGGIMVGIVATPDGGMPTIRRLGGYVEPITDPYDYDFVRGIAQVTIARAAGLAGDLKYRVRVYDLEDSTVREWTGLSRPEGMKTDVEAVAVEYLPRYRIMQTGADGIPVGDFQTALPLIQSEWASQVRGDRVEEATGFPQALIRGEVLSGVDKRGPTNIIEMSPEGDFRFVIPGDLAPMHEHHDRKLERLQNDLRLPGGSLGAQTPSGEALREAAVKYVQMCGTYADAMEGLLNELVSDFARATGSRPAAISVDINREYEKAVKIEGIISLYDHGLIPHAVAVREIHPFVATMTSEEVEAFVAREAGTILDVAMSTSGRTSEERMEEATEERANALQTLIGAGVDPDAAARVVGLAGIRFAGTN